MDMRVHANAGLVIGLRYNQVRGFSSDTFKLQQFVDLIGDTAAELLDQIAANLDDHFSLGSIETDRINQLLNLLPAKFKHLIRLSRFRE
jgi:hypothetical protein